MEETPRFIAEELLEAGAVNPDYNIRGLKVRCIRCDKIITTSPERIEELLTFYRKQETVSIYKQIRFRIPFINKDITIVIWDITKAVSPKIFMR